MTARVALLQANALTLPLRDQSVHCCITSPPYFNLRDYNVAGQIGLEERMDCLGWATGQKCGACYLCVMVDVFRQCWRVLRDDGVMFINIADSYNAAGRTGHGTRQGYKQGTNRASAEGQDRCRPSAASLKPKDLCGIPQRLALALQASGWYWRSEVTWCKKAPMPESVKDRPSRATEKILLFSKKPTYFWDQEAVRVAGGPGWNGSSFTSAYDQETKPGLGTQPRQETVGHNLWDYWLLGPEPTHNGHYASFPTALVERCIRASTSPRGVCSACGAPFVRQVASRRFCDGVEVHGSHSRPEEQFRIPANGVGHWRYATERTDHGFSPACACIATVLAAGERNPDVMDELSTPRPAIVFDPFVGSGTTVLTARALGRVGIGCDLSLLYLTIARQRLGLEALAAWEGRAAAPRTCAVDDLPLFQEDRP